MVGRVVENHQQSSDVNYLRYLKSQFYSTGAKEISHGAYK
jgi:hypothetical protein